MLYITLCVGISLFFLSIISSFEEDNIESMISFLIALALVFGSIFALISINKHIDTYEALEETEQIVSIKDNSQVSATSGLFYVSMSTDGVYTYYYKTNDGGYKQGKVNADNTIIYEEDNCKSPSIQRYCKYTQNNWSETWTKILLFSSKQDKYVSDSDRYEVHVPKGTVVQEFNLNAE